MSPMNLAGVLPWTCWRALLRWCAARRRQRLLLRVSVHAAARAGAAPRLRRATRWPRRCAPSGSPSALLVALLLGVRGVRAVGRAARDGVADRRLLRRRAARRRALRGASFCKYVCPIGQFHFVHSLVSPLEVRVREPAACAHLHDARLPARQREHAAAASSSCSCRGRSATSTARSASTACTPARTTTSASSPTLPGSDLVHDRRRSSIGRLSQRLDVAALAAARGRRGVRDGGRDGRAALGVPRCSPCWRSRRWRSRCWRPRPRRCAERCAARAGARAARARDVGGALPLPSLTGWRGLRALAAARRGRSRLGEPPALGARGARGARRRARPRAAAARRWAAPYAVGRLARRARRARARARCAAVRASRPSSGRRACGSSVSRWRCAA